MNRYNRRPPRRPEPQMSGYRDDMPQSVIDLFAADDQPMTSSERDNREAPLCTCGAPVCANGLCARCSDQGATSSEKTKTDWDAFEAANRALPADEQRD